ncbi:hypothetical protein [uncultured Eubacterium sp.]|uniref:hypothetical protein n=1 Tax=Eubacterium sp. TaxID=142586 RepID=UPI00326719F9
MPSRVYRINSGKFARWYDLVKQQGGKDFSAIICLAIEYHIRTGRYVEIARVVPYNKEDCKPTPFCLYIKKNSLVESFFKDKSSTKDFKKELDKIINTSITSLPVNMRGNEFVATLEQLNSICNKAKPSEPVIVDTLSNVTLSPNFTTSEENNNNNNYNQSLSESGMTNTESHKEDSKSQKTNGTKSTNSNVLGEYLTLIR